MRLSKLELKILRWIVTLGPVPTPQTKTAEDMFRCSRDEALTAFHNLHELGLIDGESIANRSAFAVVNGITAAGRQYLRELDSRSVDRWKSAGLYLLKEVAVPAMTSAVTGGITAWYVAGGK